MKKLLSLLLFLCVALPAAAGYLGRDTCFPTSRQALEHVCSSVPLTSQFLGTSTTTGTKTISECNPGQITAGSCSDTVGYSNCTLPFTWSYHVGATSISGQQMGVSYRLAECTHDGTVTLATDFMGALLVLFVVVLAGRWMLRVFTNPHTD